MSTITVTQLPVLGTLDEENTMAFAKLEFNGVSYLMNTLEITLGKNYPNEKYADLPLALDDNISKFHALLFYNFYSQRYELTVTGRSGAHVQDKLTPIGTTVPLESGCTIQLGDTIIKFTLPKAAETRKYEQNVIDQSMDVESKDDDDYDYVPQTDESTNSSASWDEFVGIEQEDESNVDQDNLIETQSFTMESENKPYMNAVNLCKFKTEKPIFPMWVLIACAIQESSKKEMTEKEIFSYLLENYPYFKSMDQTEILATVQRILTTDQIKFVHTTNNWSFNIKDENKIEDKISRVLAEQVVKPQTDIDFSDPHAIISSYKDKEEEPPFPLRALVMHAIHLTNEDGLTTNEILTFLQTHFPYYRSLNIKKVLGDIRSTQKHFTHMTISSRQEGYRWKADPERKYNMQESVKKSLKIVEENKKYYEAVGNRKIKYNMDPDQLVAKWLFKKERPPFSLGILTAYAINEADKNQVPMKYITDYIHEHFPFYKSLELTALQGRVRALIKTQSNAVISIRHHRLDPLYALDPDTSKELEAQRQISIWHENPRFRSDIQYKRFTRASAEDTNIRNKKIKLEEDDDSFKTTFNVRPAE